MNYKQTWNKISELIKNTRGDATRDTEHQDSTGKILIECVDKDDKNEIYDILKASNMNVTEPNKESGTLVANKFPVTIVSTTAKKLNWGHLSEGIAGIAIACRFLYKNSKITEGNYDSLLKELGTSVNELKKPSPNKNPKIKDDVFIKIDIPDNARELLYTKRNNKKYRLLVKSAIRYANSTNVSTWSKIVYENNTIDTIKVDAIGKRGQKTDIKVSITDKNNDPMPVNIDLSMKYSDVGQFGQAVGSDYDTVNNFLKSIFGHEIGAELTYNDLIYKKQFAGAFRFAYERVTSKIKNSIDVKTLVNGIQKYATGGNSQIKMLILGQKTTLLDFTKLNDWVDEHNNTWNILKEDFIVEYSEYGPDKFPKITIKLKEYGNSVLLYVRARKDQSTSKGNITYRHYIEKGSLMNELIGVELPEEDT